jgi:hypothetical protein
MSLHSPDSRLDTLRRHEPLQALKALGTPPADPMRGFARCVVHVGHPAAFGARIVRPHPSRAHFPWSFIGSRRRFESPIESAFRGRFELLIDFAQQPVPSLECSFKRQTR